MCFTFYQLFYTLKISNVFFSPKITNVMYIFSSYSICCLQCFLKSKFFLTFYIYLQSVIKEHMEQTVSITVAIVMKNIIVIISMGYVLMNALLVSKGLSAIYVNIKCTGYVVTQNDTVTIQYIFINLNSTYNCYTSQKFNY